MQIILNGFGEYLGTKGIEHLTISHNRELIEAIPIYKVKDVYLMDNNNVSTSALSLCALYNIPVFLLTHTGKLLSMSMPFNTKADCRVKTRIAQYQASHSVKGCVIAKNILLSKINNQKQLLEKYSINLSTQKIEEKISKINEPLNQQIRIQLNGYEGKISEQYFKEYFKLIPKEFKPEKRESYKAENKFNNLLNLGYEIISGEIYKAVLFSHLDPYLGYLHNKQYLKPSLIYDIIELFRYYVDEFLINYTPTLDINQSFEMKGIRPFLTSNEMKNYVIELTKTFDKSIEYQRIKKFGKKSKLGTIIKEEPIKLAQYLRDDKPNYCPYCVKKRAN